ncbi:MAG: glycosyltransferase family 87 protein [Candidatus Sulfotelmatobacter sp.]
MPRSPTLGQARTFLALAILCAACMVYYHLGIFVPRAIEVRAGQGFGNGYSFGADFYPIWRTSREVLHHHCDPYAPEMTRQIQIGLFGRSLDPRNPAASPEYRAFSYPLFADVLFWPSALLPFPLARIALALILPVLTALSVVLWLKVVQLRVGSVMSAALMLLTLTSYAVLEGLFAEQMGLLVGFLLAASLAALVRERLFLSGALLSFALIKPQMVLLVGVYLLFWSFAQFRARWRFAAGVLFVAVMLGVASLLISPRWIGEWLHIMYGYRQYSPPPLVSYLLGDEIGRLVGPTVIAALLASGIVFAWSRSHMLPGAFEFGSTVSFLLALTTITLLPGHSVYDHVLLLPGIILIAFSWRGFAASSAPFRIVLAVTTLALFWQWICAPLVVAVRPFVSRQVFISDLLTLPVRTAASIPFGVLALLGLMIWRRTRPTTAANGEKGAGEPATFHRLRIFVRASRFFAGRSRKATLTSAR